MLLYAPACSCSNKPPFGRICYPTVLNIGKQCSLSEGESNCNPQKLSACFVYKVALQMLILSPFG